MAQENQAHDGHEIFVAGEIAIRAELVRSRPQTLFDGFDIFNH
jgi:hypothetical protein